ncbi:hypothetical protein PENTCL1PPCAC_1569, partial [Pristionchus entomophagus]
TSIFSRQFSLSRTDARWAISSSLVFLISLLRLAASLFFFLLCQYASSFTSCFCFFSAFWIIFLPGGEAEERSEVEEEIAAQMLADSDVESRLPKNPDDDD